MNTKFYNSIKYVNYRRFRDVYVLLFCPGSTRLTQEESYRYQDICTFMTDVRKCLSLMIEIRSFINKCVFFVDFIFDTLRDLSIPNIRVHRDFKFLVRMRSFVFNLTDTHFQKFLLIYFVRVRHVVFR